MIGTQAPLWPTGICPGGHALIGTQLPSSLSASPFRQTGGIQHLFVNGLSV
jgi:hypothetical protein